MDEAAVCAYFGRSDAAIAFDTSAMRTGGKRWRAEVAQLVSRINEGRPGTPIRMFVPATAHAEMLHDYRQALQEKYSSAVIASGMRNLGFEVMDFTVAHAEHFARFAALDFPSSEEWREHKARRCLKCLGLPQTHPVPDRPCSATIDWFIASQADAHGHLLVVEDDGVEFRRVALRVKHTVLDQALRKLLRELPNI